MKEITGQKGKVKNKLINKFRIFLLGYDFCGYTLEKNSPYDFHHLIIPKKDCYIYRIPYDGYTYWNGVILNNLTSHKYIHFIERFDEEIYALINYEMASQHSKGYLDPNNIRRIHDMMRAFENDSRKGKYGENIVIPRDYIYKRKKFRK